MMGGAWGEAAPGAKSITLAQANAVVERYLARVGDSTLGIEEILEFQANFYVVAKEQGADHAAFELLVNRSSGAVRPEPTMMWNTKYGHMAGMMGAWARPGSAVASVTPEDARRIAQEWLDSSHSGEQADHLHAFYGYYTLMTERDGRVVGMLSVNAGSGRVWYHSWHGRFLHEGES